MALIVLLLLNATVTQVFRADGLRADPRNQRVLLDEYSRQRGQITAGGQLMAYSVSTTGRYRYLRVYPDPFVYAPVTGFYSLRYSSAGLERAEDGILNGSDQRLFGRRLADFFTGRDPRGGNVDTTIVPRDAAGRLGRHAARLQRPVQGRRGGHRTVHRARSWRWCRHRRTTPTCSPPMTSASSRRPGSSCATTRTRRLTNRAISERYPPGSTFKVITTAAALQAGLTEDEQLTALPAIPAAGQHHHPGELRRDTLRRRVRPRHCGGVRPVLQHRVRPAGPASRAPTRCSNAATVVRPGQPARRRSRCRSPNRPSGPSPTAPRWACRASGRRTSSVTPLQNAIVAATIANQGVHDAAVPGRTACKGPDLANIATTVPSQQRRAVSPQVAAKLTRFDGRRRAVHTAERGHPRRADRIEDRVPQNTEPIPATPHRTRGTSRSRLRRPRRSRSRCWWKTVATGCPRPAARSRRRSAGP